jgi:hypothetical protein
MSPPSAATFAGMSLPDLVSVLGNTNEDDDEPLADQSKEFFEYEITGVI